MKIPQAEKSEAFTPGIIGEFTIFLGLFSQNIKTVRIEISHMTAKPYQQVDIKGILLIETLVGRKDLNAVFELFSDLCLRKGKEITQQEK